MARQRESVSGRRQDHVWPVDDGMGGHDRHIVYHGTFYAVPDGLREYRGLRGDTGDDAASVIGRIIDMVDDPVQGWVYGSDPSHKDRKVQTFYDYQYHTDYAVHVFPVQRTSGDRT